MRRVIMIVLFVVIFSIGFFAQVKAEESFSVKKGSIAIITVGGVQVALSNDNNGDCGTYYIIDPATNEILIVGEILDYTYLFINEGRVNMHCLFSTVGTKKNPKLEFQPFIVKN